MELISPIFNNPTTADLIVVIKDRLVHVHKKILEKNFQDWRKLFPRGNDNNHDDANGLVERVKITDYNYETIYQYLRFYYQNQVKFTENNWEPLHHLSIQYPNSRLRKLCYDNLERRAILHPQQFMHFPEALRTDYVENVGIWMGNLKRLLRLVQAHPVATSKLEQRCSEFLLKQKGEIHMHRCYKWAHQFTRFRPIAAQLLSWANEQEFTVSNIFAFHAMAIQANSLSLREKIFDDFNYFYELKEDDCKEWWSQVPLTLDICFEMFTFVMDSEFKSNGWDIIALDRIYAKLDRELDKLGEKFKTSKMYKFCVNLRLFCSPCQDSYNDKGKQISSRLAEKINKFVENRFHWPNSNEMTYDEAHEILEQARLERDFSRFYIVDAVGIERLLIRDNLVSTFKNLHQINSYDERRRFYSYFSYVFSKLRILKCPEIYVDFSQISLEFFRTWPWKILLEFYKHADGEVKQFFGANGLDNAILYKMSDHFKADNLEDIKIVVDFMQNLKQYNFIPMSRIRISFENLTAFCSEPFLEFQIMNKVESFVFQQLNSVTGFDAYRRMVNMKNPLVDKCIDQWIQNVNDITPLNYPLKIRIARDCGYEVEKVCENAKTFLVDHFMVDDSIQQKHLRFWRKWFHKLYQLALELKFEPLQTKTFDFFTRHFESSCNEHCKVITHYYDLPWFYDMAHKHNCQHLMGLFEEFFISKFPSKPYQWYSEVVSRLNGRLRTLIEEQLLKDLTDREELRKIHEVAQIKGRFEANPTLKALLEAKLLEKCNKPDVTSETKPATEKDSNKRKDESGPSGTNKKARVSLS